MPRKRDISPSIWRSSQFLGLPSDAARLAFIAMFSLADDLGVGLLSDLRRYTGIEQVEARAKEVSAAGLTVLYEEPQGLAPVAYYLLPTWCKFQQVNRPTHSQNPLPAAWKDLVPPQYQDRYEGRRVAGQRGSACTNESGRSAPAGVAFGGGPHGVLHEDSRNAQGGLTESHLSPSPIPDQKKSRVSELAADSDPFEVFRNTWNRIAAGWNVAALHVRKSPAFKTQVRGFLSACGNDWRLVESCMEAFVRRDFHRDRAVVNRLGADTFLRPAHREDYIERGRAFAAQPAQSEPTGSGAAAKCRTELEEAQAERAATQPPHDTKEQSP